MIAGVFLGLGAAFFQSCSYLFSKRYVVKFEQGALGLLVAGHILMGFFSLLLLPFLLPKTLPPFLTYAGWLCGCVFLYLFGQASLFYALKHADASRVSPLLGLKILMLAVFSVAFTNQHFHSLQWTGIVLAVCAAGMLGTLGKEMTVKSWLWILLACLFYSLSDMSIKTIIGVFDYCGLLRASILCTCLCYFACGLIACAALPFFPVNTFSKWKAAFPFAVFWYTGIVLLFGCFGFIGVVFGNIVQSTRGVISIVMGSFVSARGYNHIEAHVPRFVVLLRFGSALMMAVAIALFYCGA